MIWSRGAIVPNDALRISVLDRVFEHGLGLFETFRTWDGRAPLLDRHLARMRRSADTLGLPLDPADLPTADDVSALLRADGRDDDDGGALLRITLSGGLGPSEGSSAWMRSAPLPDPVGPDGAVIGFGTLRLDEGDVLARHKTLNAWSRRLSHERARASGADERLTFTPDGRVWEGTRTNLFVVRSGVLWTPGLDGPILPGILRGLVLERARRLDIRAIETDLNLATIERADEVFLTNSVRGVVPVGRLYGRVLEAPGPLTRALRRDIVSWLESGGTAP